MEDFFFKILDLALGGFLERRRKRKALQNEFDAIRRRIFHLTLLNNLPIELQALRNCFLDQGLVDRPGFHSFFQKWLSHPIIQQGIPALGLVSAAEFQQLKAELVQLQI